MKTKRIISLVLALVMLLSLCACASQEGPEGVEIPSGFLMAENEKTDYYFFYPSTWILDRNDAGMTSAYVSENDFSNISVTTFTASVEYPTLLDYAEKYYFAKFEDNFNNLKVEKNQDGSLKRSSLKVDGCEALAVNYTATFSGENYGFRVWFISRGGYIYTVLYTAKEALYEAHIEEATAIAENLKFR